MLLAVLLGCALFAVLNLMAGGRPAPQRANRHHSMGGRQLQMMTRDEPREELNNLMLPLQLARPPANAEIAASYIVVETFSRATVRNHLDDLLLLQCWAGKRNTKMVTPWVQKSELVTPLTDWLPRGGQLLPIETFYDVNAWSKEAESRGAAELSDLSDFFSLAPKDVAIIHFKPTCHQFVSNQSWTMDYTQLKGNGFTITTELCVPSISLTPSSALDELSKIMTTLPNPITLLMKDWGTIPSKMSHSCTKYTKDLTIIPPSKRVTEDANKYINSYLRGGRHISVVVGRTAARAKSFPACIERTLTTLHVMRGQNITRKPFLTVQDHDINNSLNFHMFFKAVYHRTLTLPQWNKQLQAAGSIDNVEYKTLVQQVVSWSGGCLVLAGRSDQEQYLIQHYHKSVSGRYSCFASIKQCLS